MFLKPCVPRAALHIGLNSALRGNKKNVSLRGALSWHIRESIDDLVGEAVRRVLTKTTSPPGTSPYGELCDKQFAALRLLRKRA